MDKYNLKDALLFISRGDTHEILIETNQRTRPDVQSNLQELLKLYPDINPKVVSLSELQEAGQDEKNRGPKERIIHLKDLADVSESEKKVLSYFETARKLGASDIHFLISESIFKVRMRIFGELQTVDEDQPALGYSLCATAILWLRCQFLPSKGAGCAPVPTINAKNRNIWCTLQSQTYGRRSDCSYAPDTR
uniref:ATP-binding protein n=1 Tax=Escherichia coli TaxID=562 RepID=A0A8F1IF46_ECOLX|nr:hypothetical protein [Escherichia coli]QWP89252.1 hypothetical protein IHCLGBEB_00055 [Escherichia coli]